MTFCSQKSSKIEWTDSVKFTYGCQVSVKGHQVYPERDNIAVQKEIRRPIK